MKKLSVVIPAFNEEKRIGKTLLAISEFLKKQIYDYEILVISDGSQDRTVKVVEDLKLQVPKLSIISNVENHGKGWVTKQGMLNSTGDVRLFMDADNSTKVDEITKFLPFFEEGYDLVIGSRRIKGSVIATRQPWIRDFEGSLFRFIVHLMVPLKVTDSQCGFKAFSAKAVEAIFPKQSIYRWAFDVEVLALARKEGLKTKELPVTWVNDLDSHVKLSGKINMLLEVAEIRYNLLTGRYNK